MAKCYFCDSELIDNEIKNYKTMCKICYYDIMETKIERDYEYYNNYDNDDLD